MECTHQGGEQEGHIKKTIKHTPPSISGLEWSPQVDEQRQSRDLNN
jgi:hypothetical protein